jgi:hypothetical protein
VLLATLLFGALVRNTLADARVVARNFGLVGMLSTLVLFALTGALLDFPAGPGLWLLGVAFVLARSAGKTAAVAALALASGIERRKGVLIGIGLAPMSTLALILVHDTTRRYPGVDAAFGGVMLAGVALMQIAGPLATQWAAVAAAEAAPPPERAPWRS